MYPVLLVILAAGFATLAWRRFPLALSLLFALLPAYLLRFSLGPVPSSMLEVFILTLAAVWVVRHSSDVRRIAMGLITSRWRFPFALLAAAVVVGTIAAPNIVDAIGLVKAYFIEPTLVVAMVLTTFGDDDWKRSLRFLLGSAAAVSAVAILQHLTGLGIPVPWDIERRVTSVFDFPNAVGLFLAPIVASATVLSLKIRDPFSRSLAATTCLLGSVAIVLAKTEAALIAVPTALLLVLWLSEAKRRTTVAATTAAAVLLIIALAIPAARSKLLLEDYSGTVRRSQWSETLSMLADRPFTGAGISGYPTALEPYHDATMFEIFQYPHNLVLNIWTELGLLGLAAFIWLGALLVRHAIRERKNAAVLIASAALLAMVIHGLVDVSFFKNDLAVLTVFFVSLLVASPRIIRE